MPERRFPRSRTAEETNACFIVAYSELQPVDLVARFN